ncbi:hypothetical protein KP806_23280 [Paenibacillus sp. N4]|uniref:hypothetical protein n=1 Tax=Paenibacillus vietnamensis TaxID=2590547 RepID=UPI001CD0AFBA|nr:hypothetical protein [Paenibacillus vietnamensis]MCA0757987.1 hypothetical protein [Paenibacillus vietnamensis]
MATGESYVLSPSDVRNIRSYIQYKYAGMPQELLAEIVADALSRIIHKRLPDFGTDESRSITNAIVRRSVLEQQRPVRSEDLLAECLQLDRTRPDIFDALHEWVEEHLQIRCQKPVMRRLMDKLQSGKSEVGENPESLWGQLRALLEAEGMQPDKVEASDTTAAVKLYEFRMRSARAKKSGRNLTIAYGILGLSLLSSNLLYGWSLGKPSVSILQPPVMLKQTKAPEPSVEGLPAELRYREVDLVRLNGYLEKRSSALAESPYFASIVDAAAAFDIHPALLFAITGQEQAFVPKSNKLHKKIANNPFNVFHSWREFNTTIGQSSEIAARTIVNLSKGRPEDTDPFTWINRKYAEDPNWADGVRSIFKAITAYLEKPGTHE